MSAVEFVGADAPGPAAALTSVPTLTLLLSTFSAAPGAISAITISLALPPTCKPALAPPMLYIAGGDHLPLKLVPSRHTIGPRPPVPPMPTANFFTLGRMMMQSAFARTLGGMSLLATIACRIVVALRMVSSSPGEAPHEGRARKITVRDASRQERTLWVRSITIFPPC